MKFPVKTTVAVLVLGVGGMVAYPRLQAYWKEHNRPHYRLAPVVRGEITSVVNSTGTVDPVRRVQVGCFVSGPIENLYVQHNDEVKAGDLMAEIDPRIYNAQVARDEAALATAKAEVERTNALLEQARNDEQRAKALQQENKEYISDTEMDQFKYNRMSLEAQLEVAQASVSQAEANLKNSQDYLEYTKIKAPEDGIVIDSKIEQGQTVVAQFQTPELFVLAPNMREKMRVVASVDEADIGLIQEAKRKQNKVQFTVDAYPDDLFEGTIYQVRLNPTTTQNVVTYPVIVEAPNPELKLLPGMTASLSFQIEKHKDVVKIPNAALRFYPKLEQVCQEDRKLLEGTLEETESSDEDEAAAGRRSAEETAVAKRNRHRRHVWIIEGDLLRAVEITTGINDYKFTEMVSGELKDGQELVTGLAPKS
jgi:HlyD family secretion protein